MKSVAVETSLLSSRRRSHTPRAATVIMIETGPTDHQQTSSSPRQFPPAVSQARDRPERRQQDPAPLSAVKTTLLVIVGLVRFMIPWPPWSMRALAKLSRKFPTLPLDARLFEKPAPRGWRLINDPCWMILRHGSWHRPAARFFSISPNSAAGSTEFLDPLSTVHCGFDQLGRIVRDDGVADHREMASGLSCGRFKNGRCSVQSRSTR